jgi:hypothetical protein
VRALVIAKIRTQLTVVLKQMMFYNILAGYVNISQLAHAPVQLLVAVATISQTRTAVTVRDARQVGHATTYAQVRRVAASA